MASLCVAVLVCSLVLGLQNCRLSLADAEARLPVQSSSRDVTVNNAYQLAELSMCATGLSLYSFYRDYNYYGCWCGYGGTGDPVDATDTCCKAHDDCFLQTLSSTCYSRVLWYTLSYHSSASGCGTSSVSITCKKASDYPWYYFGEDCAAAICNCDRVLALCFKANRPTYNSSYRNWDTC